MEYVSITPERIVVSGRTLELYGRGGELLTSAYRKHVAGWPKFFKMETLSRVAFIASELLPGMDDMPEGQEFREDRAVILFGSTASYSADCAYQATVADAANYYPSPAIFVYTLPNIACGEIAIRRHLRGETAFYVIDRPDARTMLAQASAAFQDSTTQSILLGWVDSRSADEFSAFVALVRRNDDVAAMEKEIRKIINE